MEVHDTHSHEPVFCFSTIPAKKARCLEAARKHLLSSGGRPCRALLPCGQPPACLCWRRVSLRFQRGRTTSSGTDFLTQLSGRMLDLQQQIILLPLVCEFLIQPVVLAHQLRAPHALSKFVPDCDNNMARQKRLPQRPARSPGLPLLACFLFVTLLSHSPLLV